MDIKAATRSRSTPLIIAVGKSCLHVVSFLLEYGGDLHAVTPTTDVRFFTAA